MVLFSTMETIMASMTMWTIGDLAELTTAAAKLSLTTEYCEHCMVVSIGVGDKYCIACVTEMIDDMALGYSEQVALEMGLY